MGNLQISMQKQHSKEVVMNLDLGTEKLAVRAFGKADDGSRILYMAVTNGVPFIAKDVRDNAQAALPLVRGFLKDAKAGATNWLAVEAKSAFREAHGIITGGVLAVINIETGRTHTHPDVDNNPGMMQALRELSGVVVARPV